LPTHGEHRRIRRDGGINLLASATVIAEPEQTVSSQAIADGLADVSGIVLAAKQRPRPCLSDKYRAGILPGAGR